GPPVAPVAPQAPVPPGRPPGGDRPRPPARGGLGPADRRRPPAAGRIRRRGAGPPPRLGRTFAAPWRPARAIGDDDPMIERVITGGQTGADQGGLRAARAAGIPTGRGGPPGAAAGGARAPP